MTGGPPDYRECDEGELVWEFNDGRPRIRTYPNGGTVLVHRLAAVAWNGFDAVADRQVHHRVPVSWLNVESNLLPLPEQEHWELSGRQQKEGIHEQIVADVVGGLEVSKVNQGRVPVGKCPTHGYVTGDDVHYRFPCPAKCEKCGSELTQTTVADAERVAELEVAA